MAALTFDNVPAAAKSSAITFDDVPAIRQSALDTFTSGAAAPYKLVAKNALEGLGNSIDQTGAAMGEPMNSPGVTNWTQHPIMGPVDAVMRGIGKVGNAIASPASAVLGALGGGVGGAVEPALPAIANGISKVTGGDASKITPEQYHGVAMQFGNDIANAVAMAKGGQQGEANLRQQQGLSPIQPPRDPLQPVYDKMKAMTADNSPRAGFLKSNSSDPMQPPPAETYSAAELKAGSSGYYKQMRDAGAALNQNGINAVTSAIDTDLKASGAISARRHGDTLEVIDALREDAKSGNMDLEKLDQYRQDLLDVVKDNTSKLDGMNGDAMKANVAIQAIDKAVNGLGGGDISNPSAVDSLNQARDLYSASARTRDMQRIIDNAYTTDNPATSIKRGFANLAKQVNTNPRGDTPEEVQAINHAAHTGIIGGALKFGGSRIISAIVGGMGGASGGPVGAAAGAAAGGMLATPLRMGANALQAGRAQNAIDMISQRPAVQAAMNPPQATPSAPAASLPLKSIMQLPPSQARALLQSMLIPKQTPAGK